MVERKDIIYIRIRKTAVESDEFVGFAVTDCEYLPAHCSALLSITHLLRTVSPKLLTVRKSPERCGQSTSTLLPTNYFLQTN
jgi:hypothetical protein